MTYVERDSLIKHVVTIGTGDNRSHVCLIFGINSTLPRINTKIKSPLLNKVERSKRLRPCVTPPKRCP
ncbi:hypothetical protein L596_001485 [Steinernema carpocapsae]|uniref:Uncharacterized protein n=1 Tax=Steinernema carpocapsae TaxID=34508 RepID=A0A4U8UQD7_STECR|nr:hypothetical protein L596_001485 [Steinernema carpocapsae]